MNKRASDSEITGTSSTKQAKMTRRVCIGGNWKCNGTTAKVGELIAMLKGAEIPNNVDVVVAPPALHIGTVMAGVPENINVAIQNSWSEPKAGAWTGEITVDLIKDFGLKWVILGHSERRAYCHETPELVGKKTKLALEAGLNVIGCVGEQLKDREAGKTMDVCIAQLKPIMDAIPEGKIGNVVIAYEPVWAIGTGVTATPEQAQETHKQIRAWLAANYGATAAEGMRIQYGGSVNAKNCEALIGNPDIDGFLVGGASLKEEFKTIIQSGSLKAKM